MSQESEMDPASPNEYRRKKSDAGTVLLLLLALAFIVALIPWFLKPEVKIYPKGLAPEIKAAGWINGEAPTTESLKGKVVVICCWATSSEPCRKEAPHWDAVHKKFADRGVNFIGLTTDGENELDKVQQFLKKAGITWLNGWGADETCNALKTEGIPALYVIDRTGHVVWFSQDKKNNGESLEDIIQAVLTQRSNGS